jgi:hypothetical protein
MGSDLEGHGYSAISLGALLDLIGMFGVLKGWDEWGNNIFNRVRIDFLRKHSN